MAPRGRVWEGEREEGKSCAGFGPFRGASLPLPSPPPLPHLPPCPLVRGPARENRLGKGQVRSAVTDGPAQPSLLPWEGVCLFVWLFGGNGGRAVVWRLAASPHHRRRSPSPSRVPFSVPFQGREILSSGVGLIRGSGDGEEGEVGVQSPFPSLISSGGERREGRGRQSPLPIPIIGLFASPRHLMVPEFIPYGIRRRLFKNLTSNLGSPLRIFPSPLAPPAKRGSEMALPSAFFAKIPSFPPPSP